MPQVHPPYHKVIFITYSISLITPQNEYSHNVAMPSDLGKFIYQRLKYAHLPVRTYGVDEAIGGGGFDYNSVEKASPLIAIVAGDLKQHGLSVDLSSALSKGKEIFLVLFDQTEIPAKLENCRQFNFYSTSRWEEGFQELKAILMEREYPPPYTTLPVPNGEYYLKEARAQYDNTSSFFREYYYMNVFDDIYNKVAKQQAIRDLGQQKILGGLIAAVLKDDPHEEVRTEAVLALAKFDGYDYYRFISEATEINYPYSIKAYAEIAKLYRGSPEVIQKLVLDLQNVFLNNPQQIKQNQIKEFSPTEYGDSLGSQVSTNQIFISYARRDAEEVAIEIADRLGKIGFDIWLDTHLEPGTNIWSKEVQQAIQRSTLVLAILSPAVHDSEWVKIEWLYAKGKKKTIIPIYALETNEPFELTGSQGLRGNPLYSDEPEKVRSLLTETLEKKGLRALG
jgi:hypothetical protein